MLLAALGATLTKTVVFFFFLLLEGRERRRRENWEVHSSFVKVFFSILWAFPNEKAKAKTKALYEFGLWSHKRERGKKKKKVLMSQVNNFALHCWLLPHRTWQNKQVSFIKSHTRTLLKVHTPTLCLERLLMTFSRSVICPQGATWKHPLPAAGCSNAIRTSY